MKITATDVNVENFCDALKKYRITCKELFLSDVKWKRKKCAMLINTVKASKVGLNSAGCGRFKALSQCKHLVSSLSLILTYRFRMKYN